MLKPGPPKGWGPAETFSSDLSSHFEMKFSLSIGKFGFDISTSRKEALDHHTAAARHIARRETTDRPPRSAGSRMYDAARVNRLTSDVPVTITSANAEILVSAIAMRSFNRT